MTSITDNEINNLVYLCLKYVVVGFPMRDCDFQCILMIYNSVGEGRDKLSNIISDFIWDHVLGEPDEPSLDKIKSLVTEIFNGFFDLPYDIRNDIKSSTEVS